MTITEIVKDNQVEFSFYRAGNFYYRIKVKEAYYLFPVPIDDIGQATLLASDKAIMFMRYIRQALENQTFISAE